MSDKMKTLPVSNRVYDILKYAAQIVLPAIGGLYFALSEIWGFPNGVEIVGTITAVDAFLGVVLGISSAAYNKSETRFDGSIDIVEDDRSKLFTLNVDGDPNDLEFKDEVLFKINTTNTSDHV